MITPQQADVGSTYRVRLLDRATLEYRRTLPRTVQDALHRGDRRVVVDCSSWAKFDLFLLSALVNCASVCHGEGAEFELENLSHDIRSTIEALGLASRLHLLA
jgi:anti-anti-sigma regulatory factor